MTRFFETFLQNAIHRETYDIVLTDGSVRREIPTVGASSANAAQFCFDAQGRIDRIPFGLLVDARRA